MNVAAMDDVAQPEVYQRWDDGFVLRKMRRHETDQVLKWLCAYRDVCYELQVCLDMRESDTGFDGLYTGELNGRMVASLVVTPIADDLRFLGFLYVAEQCRRSGFARRMLTAAVDVERSRRWNGVAYLITLSNMESMYMKLDYKTTTKLTAYRGIVSPSVDRDRHGTDVIQVTTQGVALAHIVANYFIFLIQATWPCVSVMSHVI